VVGSAGPRGHQRRPPVGGGRLVEAKSRAPPPPLASIALEERWGGGAGGGRRGVRGPSAWGSGCGHHSVGSGRRGRSTRRSREHARGGQGAARCRGEPPAAPALVLRQGRTAVGAPRGAVGAAAVPAAAQTHGAHPDSRNGREQVRTREVQGQRARRYGPSESGSAPRYHAARARRPAGEVCRRRRTHPACRGRRHVQRAPPPSAEEGVRRAVGLMGV